MKTNKKMTYYKLDQLIKATKYYIQETHPEMDCYYVAKQMKRIFRDLEAEKRSIPKKSVTEISLSTLEKAPFLDDDKYVQSVVKGVISGIKEKFLELGFQVIEK